jgi:hypothetical protein
MKKIPWKYRTIALLLGLGLAIATTPTLAANLTGSNFESDDGNLKVDNASRIDWVSVNETRKNDLPTGQNDDSFGNGTKEDTAVPTVIDGSIPNNKSDLKTFGVYTETAGTSNFIHLFWTRVQEPTGTTNMDFEFNQSSTLSSNGVTPVRTTNDLLITYDLSQGGTVPTISLRRWTSAGGGSWGPATALNSTLATGSINTTAIPASESDNLGSLSARTFGEASISLAAIFTSASCTTFGSAYLKSRSSDAFTAAVKDFIAPVSVNISNCGRVVIHKQTVPDGATGSFDFTHNLEFLPDTGETSFSLSDDGTEDREDVVAPGSYYVSEDDPSSLQFDLTDISCSSTNDTTALTTDLATRTVTFALATSEKVECTFTNTKRLGAIKITKTRKHAADGPGDHPHAGVDFTVNGVTVTTNASGEACIDGLQFGNYDVTETVPGGYVAAGDTTKTVAVIAVAACGSGNEATVGFHNTPLTNITVSVDSQVDGGTASTIDCVVDSASTDTNGDGSLTLEDLEPGTYTCTIVVDP